MNLLQIIAASKRRSAGITAFAHAANYGGTQSSASTYTFSACDLGAAHADRWIVAAIGLRTSASASPITAVTIGGVAATLDKQAGGITNVASATIIARAKVTSGTTGDIVVTAGSTVAAGVSVYRFLALDLVVNDTDSVSVVASSQTVFDLAVDLADNGVAIACIDSRATDYSWTGVTENHDADYGLMAFSSASASFPTAVSNQLVRATKTAGNQYAAMACVSYK